MRIFISAGEPSGDLHGGNLARALARQAPGVDCVGFGGERMAAAGCRLLYPLSRLSVMWFARVVAKAPSFLALLSQADRYFHHRRPDAVILIDYPGFNWWLARRAHFHGIPVFYFVPPQLWAWAGWRVRKMRRWVDHVLCSLPFEESWYCQRGVNARYLGHPYFDELAAQETDREFVAVRRKLPGPMIGLLPGSRTQEIRRNLKTLLEAATRVHNRRPDARFLFACFQREHGDEVTAHLHGRGLPAEVCVGKTPEVIELAHSCVAVSGSVGLELLYRTKPATIVYRIGRVDLRLARPFMTTPHISLVNLLAGRELYPEFLTDHCPAEAVADHVLRWLDDGRAYAELRNELASLRRRVAQPGACERAAQYVLDRMLQPAARSA